ncbi:MAG: GGDEF domain-containing protein [Fibrobacter sp.]|jgi:diguanylate cyclase (GGDEF)-like protein|nr:GGDEF domain-containing protein [Fibrobacter sp.]
MGHLLDLVNMDSRTLIGVLFWICIAWAIIIYMYQALMLERREKKRLFKFALIRIGYAVSFFLFFFRNQIPDILSVHFANTLLFFCIYCDASILLSLIFPKKTFRNHVLTSILLICAVAFNAIILITKNPSSELTLASITIFALYLVPTISLIQVKSSRFKRAISIFYMLLLATLVPRALNIFNTDKINILYNDCDQTTFFLAQIVLMFLTVLAYLLFIKEDNDVRIREMATTDALTNIPNRFCFFEQANRVFSRARFSKVPNTFLFLDIDHFKTVNDTYHHHFGDVVLIEFARILKRNLRPFDLFCRYGGEEFLVMLPAHDEKAGEIVAERIMKDFSNLTFDLHPEVRLTVSVGIFSAVPGYQDDLSDFIRKADSALYEAKNTGRNRIVVFEDKVMEAE